MQKKICGLQYGDCICGMQTPLSAYTRDMRCPVLTCGAVLQGAYEHRLGAQGCELFQRAVMAVL
eukprot:1520575-Rhodomonas_salina.2